MQHNMHTVAFYREQSRRANDRDISIGAAQYAAWLECECSSRIHGIGTIRISLGDIGTLAAMI